MFEKYVFARIIVVLPKDRMFYYTDFCRVIILLKNQMASAAWGGVFAQLHFVHSIPRSGDFLKIIHVLVIIQLDYSKSLDIRLSTMTTWSL